MGARAQDETYGLSLCYHCFTPELLPHFPWLPPVQPPIMGIDADPQVGGS